MLRFALWLHDVALLFLRARLSVMSPDLFFFIEDKLIRTALKTPQSCVSMCCRILHVGRPSTATAQILSFLENRFYTSNRIASQTIAASRCLDGAKYMKNSRDFSFQSGIQKDHKHMQPITGIPNNNEKWASRDIPKHFCSARGWAKACRCGSPLANFIVHWWRWGHVAETAVAGVAPQRSGVVFPLASKTRGEGPGEAKCAPFPRGAEER